MPRLGELLRELDALGLAAGERGRGLAEVDVAEADVVQRLELLPDRGHVLQELRGLRHGHVEHVGDGRALVLDLERLAVVAPPAAASHCT